MSNERKPDDRRQIVRDALRAIDDLQAQLATAQGALRAPIAVVGIGCRYPGAVTGPDSFWRLLATGTDAIAEVPADRWDISHWYDADRSAPGKMSTRWGGFLDNVDQFDANFFGIAPREAALLDPQHRILLEVAWEALEHGGQPFADLAGSQTGIFVGLTNNEYYQNLLQSTQPASLSPYLATGNVLNAAAGRLAFFLGTHGPSIAVDTACSSSLTAIHLACQSLRAGDCQMALAGGVNVIVVPETSVMFSKWGMMAADGRCKTFDAAADGFVRSEGCGVVVLKRLDDALAAGDRILAVIEGSAINQDGRSSGLTVPNGIAQQALIRQALASAGVEPSQIDYVEAHGTGTSLGDPIEVDALAAVFGPARAQKDKLKIGSVKTNLGHTESASGVAGFIKCVLALEHGQIPAQLHFRQPTPEIAWESIPIEVVAKPVAWPRGTAPRRAGVSSFGFSGANAHIVICEPPAASVEVDLLYRPRHLLTVSARDPQALSELARRYATALSEPATGDAGDFCFTANTGRAQFQHRLAVCGESAAELAAALSNVDTRSGSPARGHWQGEPVKVAFLFTGQGSQYAGMGRPLYDSQPVFRAQLDRCASLLAPHLDQPLLDILFGALQQADRLNQTRFTQPALFALEWSLAEMWRSWGVAPAALLGHSVGEYVAACQAGVMSLEDGLRLICARAELMQSLPPGGMMAAVASDEATVLRALAPHSATAAIAAVNGPRNVVVSGRSDTIKTILDQLRSQQIDAVPLNVSHAFHSPLLEPILDSLEHAAAQLHYSAPRVPLVSNLTGAVAHGDEVASASYWRQHARSPVRFADGIAELQRKGCKVFLEIGPAPVLTNMGRQCLPEDGQAWFPSLVKGHDAWTQVLQSLSELYVRGVPVDWAGFDRGHHRRRLALPTYPFQRKRFWVDRSSSGNAAQRDQSQNTAPEGAMLLAIPGSPLVKETVFAGELGIQRQPWLADHVVAGPVVVPMTAYIEMVRAAGAETFQTPTLTIEDLVLSEPLRVNADELAKVQLVLSPTESVDVREFRIISLSASNPSDWQLHASGRVRRSIDSSNVKRRSDDMLDSARQATFPSQVDHDEHYRVFAAQGIDFGPAFRGVQRVFSDAETSRGEICQPDYILSTPTVFHPALLDACLQPLLHVWPQESKPRTFLPFAVERIDFWGIPTATMTSYCQARKPVAAGADTLIGDVTLCDALGEVVGAVHGLTARRLGNSDAAEAIDDWFYEVEWQVAAAGEAKASDGALAPVAAITRLAQRNRPGYLRQAAAQGFTSAAAILDSLSLSYMVAALKALGCHLFPGEQIDRKGLAAQFGIQVRHERLLARMLDALTAAGCLKSESSGWTITDVVGNFDRTINVAAAIDSYPEFAAEFRLLERCGARLADVLRGDCNPLDLLFGADAAEDLEKIYSDSPTTTAINQLAADVFSGLAEHLPAGRRLSVLEIGAGTGGTTAHVLGRLPADRTNYCFTDISPALVARARSRFGEFPFVEFDVLDIERDLESQGFADRRFDVVLAANVLHATADLGGALAQAQRLLAPGGTLVLAEGTRPQNWIDLTFGLTDGWWKFTDRDLRPDYPLLDSAAWLRLLAEQGFGDTIALGGPVGADGQAPDYSLFVAGGNAPTSESESKNNTWLIFADDHGHGDAIAAELAGQGCACLKVRRAAGFEQFSADEFGLDPAAREDYTRLLAHMENSGRQSQGVVHAWSLDTNLADAATLDQLAESQENSCRSFLYLAQSLAAAGQSLAGGLWAITRGSQSVDGDVQRVAASQATVWGLGKVLALEHPELNVIRLDLPVEPRLGSAEAKSVAGILLRPLEESQAALRGGATYVPRLLRKRQSRSTGPLRLNAVTPGRLDSLEWQPSTRRAPGAGEIEIRVEAVGLNFRDVLSALDMYPGDAGPLGGEVAGVVVNVGPGGSDFAVGDAVAALAIGGFSDFVVTAADLAMRKPRDWSFAGIATIPAAFATAYHALVQLAQIGRGQRVLIHTAAGGVGLAAVQLTLAAGCEVIATAGSPEKREYLRSVGASHVYDSRSLTFASEIRALIGTGGGIDVVLNTLSGEFIDASLSLLSPSGCFVELGKRGIWDAARVAAVRPQARYHIVDLAARSQHTPADLRPILAAATAAAAAGTLRPLPFEVFARDQVQAAFRHMAQARHIGKIVVSCATTGAAETPSRFNADPAGNYLITGGLAGLGLRTAQWLAARGAKHLTLMARSEPGSQAQQAVADLRAAGIEVLICRGDVARRDDIDRVLQEIRAAGSPLRGVIHSAGVLDDGAILQQDWSRFERVFGPKVSGAWNLHQATLDLPLDIFVCYSSASAILGSKGQGNHAAANAFLDALTHHRRGLGLAALSINWGAWSDIGAAVRRDVFDRVADFGVGVIDPERGIAALERLIVNGSVQATVVPMDWRRFLAVERPAADRRFFAALGVAPPAVSSRRGPEKPASLEIQLHDAHPADRRKLIQSHLRDAVVGVLGLDPDCQLDPLQAFRDLGFDSLMSIELRNRLQASLGRPLPATLVFDFPSLAALVDYFHSQWTQRAPAQQCSVEANGNGPDLGLISVQQLSPAEAEQLLAEELAKSRELLS